MEDVQRECDMTDDGINYGPVEYFNMLERMMYNRRYVFLIQLEEQTF